MCVLVRCFEVGVLLVLIFFFKQKTAYEMRISDWSSDVCSSDLYVEKQPQDKIANHAWYTFWYVVPTLPMFLAFPVLLPRLGFWLTMVASIGRSEEHTSELQSLMRISYAVFCLKKKTPEHMQTRQPSIDDTLPCFMDHAHKSK